MSGPRRAPRWLAAVLLLLLPAGYGDEVVTDLEADAARRFGADRGRSVRVGLWYLSQVASPSMAVLIWKLRFRPLVATWSSGLASEMSATVRGLTRRPFFTLAVVASLGLGIGSNTALFSVVNGVLLRPLEYAEPDRLIFVWNRIPGFELTRLPLSGIQVAELRREADAFEDVAGIWGTTQTVVADDRALLVPAAWITPNFFSVLGAEPALGRGFTEAEGTADGATVILSDALWHRDFGADADIVGRSIQLEGGAATIVGVLPPDFRLAFPPEVGVPERPEVYVPYPWAATQRPGSRFLRTVARLRPGVGEHDADVVVKRVAARLRDTYADMAETGDDFAAVAMQRDAVERVRPALLALMGGVVVFLLLTSANVANLVLARGAVRRREVAIRSCLGASRSRLARQFITEIGALAVAGTALGLLLGSWGARLLWAARPEGLARVDDVGLDLRVFAFTVAAAAVAAVMAAFAPLASLRRHAPMASLREAGATRATSPGRARRFVTGVELALSVVLAVGAGLVGETLVRLQKTDLGFEPAKVLTFRVGLSLRQFATDRERAQLAQRIEDELKALPGVTAAGATSHIPLADWSNWSDAAAPPGTPAEVREGFHFDHRSVSPGYMEALGATLVSGRHFRTDDIGSSQASVIVDEVLADRVFGGEDPIGRVLVASRFVDQSFVPTPAVVVGVVKGLRDRSPATASAGQLFWPFAQSARWELTYAVRTEGDPSALVEGARSLVRDIRKDLAATDFRPLESYVTQSMSQARFTSTLAVILSFMALLLAGLGLYGVVSYSTARRTRELGLYLALGARERDLFWSVLGEGMGVGLVGVTVGLAIAAGSARYLETLLYGVDPLDPLVFGSVGTFLLLVTVVASWAPALRATRVDPMRSLQGD